MKPENSSCTAMRWKIPGFLNGDLPAEMMEEVRTHLDACAECALVLAHPARVDAANTGNIPPLRADFTEQLLERLPASFTGQKLAAFVALAFFASGVFGIGIWAGIKWLLGEAAEVAQAAGSVPAAESSGFYQSLLAPATLQYLALGLLAVVVCFVVIAIVDRPRNSARSLSEKS